ncbi:MAG: hypothetical protein GW905_07360 [Rhodobacterales bacterium]|nr:hypothetical protein [Rhodobacterales bacterium]
MARLKHDAPLFHEGCTLTNSTFGAYTEIGLGSCVTNSHIGDYRGGPAFSTSLQPC